MSAFPEGFEWGTATAAHQIEGGNWNNDWWEWEHTPSSGCTEPSGDACDSWHRWDEDVDLCRQLGLGNYRFSIEWSRIEPEEGEWSRAALDHYRRIGEALLAAGIDPVVTFHHFTTPRWLAARGGWAEPRVADAFARFCERAARALAPVMRRACTINEPNIVALHGYQTGVFPPGRAGAGTAAPGRRPLLRGPSQGGGRHPHRRPRRAGRADAVDGRLPGGGRRRGRREQIVRSMEDVFLDATEGDDFLGVQVYTRERVGARRSGRQRGRRPRPADGLRVLAPGPRGVPAPGVGVHRG